MNSQVASPTSSCNSSLISASAVMVESDEFESSESEDDDQAVAVAAAGGITQDDDDEDDDSDKENIEDDGLWNDLEKPYKAPPKDSQSRRWMFTLNNWTEAEYKELHESINVAIDYLIMGKEVAPKTGTPHIQGFFYFGTNRRFSTLKKKYNRRICWTRPSCKDTTRVINYHKKGIQSKAEWKRHHCKGKNWNTANNWEEWGVPPVDKSGQRSELTDAKEFITREAEEHGIVNRWKLFNENFTAVARAPVVLDDWSKMEEQRVRRAKQIQECEEIVLRPWQEYLLTKILNPVERQVLFVVDKVGGMGKTTFCKWLGKKYPELNPYVLKPGKLADMTYELSKYSPPPKCIIVDAPRSRAEILQYDFLEGCKDGFVSSPKYHSCHSYLEENTPVAAMMNEVPNLCKLTLSRYHVIYIDDKEGNYRVFDEAETPFPSDIFKDAERARKMQDSAYTGSDDEDDDDDVYEPRESRRRNKKRKAKGGVFGMDEQFVQTMMAYMAEDIANKRQARMFREEQPRAAETRPPRARDDHPLSAAERAARREQR